jgi:hypothetical protein
MKYTISFFILSLIACQQDRQVKNQANAYYSIDSLIKAQVEALNNVKMMLEKTVEMDGQSEIQLISADSVNWLEELQLFISLDLNKPRYLGAINVEKDQNGVSYTPRSGEKIPVQLLRIEMENEQLVWIKGIYLDDDAKSVYTTGRQFKLLFVNNLIKSYEIRGYQKMALNDTVRFRIQGTIN